MRQPRTSQLKNTEHILANTLLPGCQQLFDEHEQPSWVFQQDNDPTHKKTAPKVIAKWNEDHASHTVTLLPNWPPNTPDLSPIENLWGWAQRKVDTVACNTFEEFVAVVEKTLLEVDKSILVRLFDSVPGRLRQCIEKQGGKTKY